MKKTIIFVVLTIFLWTGCSLAASVRLGIDNIDQYPQVFAGKRVGLITNPTGVNSRLQSTINVLLTKNINLVALYGPEHGVRGNTPAGEYVDGGIDASGLKGS